MNAGVGTGKRSDHQHTLGWNQILDGAASMVGNSQHVRHTPTVKMTIDGGTEHNNSGKSVCARCYLYVNTSVSFVLPPSGKSDAIDEGIVVCNEEGKFFDTRARSPGDESACHSKPKSLNQVEGNPFIASATIWRTTASAICRKNPKLLWPRLKLDRKEMYLPWNGS